MPNGWGCGYVYRFRVPLLVVSAYTPAGYVSGAISGPPACPPPPKCTHDFGSILAFIENNGVVGGGLADRQGYTCGVVFKLSLQTGGKWKYSVVHKFTGRDGGFPNGVIIDDKGNLYGTTQAFSAPTAMV